MPRESKADPLDSLKAYPCDTQATAIALLGIPTDRNSSYRRGTAAGPAAVRRILASDVGNAATESGRELYRDLAVLDFGDMAIPDGAGEAKRITDKVLDIVGGGRIPLTIGGDHSITYPIVRGLAKIHGPLNILHIDAHPDLYADFGGNPSSHASPFARIMESGLASRLVQVGIRTLNSHQREQAERFNVEIIGMRNFEPSRVPVLDAPLYISVDLDGLDPAFAPGVSHHEPGGLSTRQLLDVLHSQTASLVGADVVELNPTYDVHDITAALVVKLIKELAALCHAGRPI